MNILILFGIILVWCILIKLVPFVEKLLEKFDK